MSDLKSLLAPISTFVATLDLEDAGLAEQALAHRFPPEGEEVSAVTSAALAALKAGTICQKGEGALKFSRIAKPEADPGHCSIDAVWMDSSVGPVHTHLKGEVCLCIALAGTPNFEGRTDRWMVLPPKSRHNPTVKNGTMLILYWWPDGAVAWS